MKEPIGDPVILVIKYIECFVIELERDWVDHLKRHKKCWKNCLKYPELFES